MAHLGDAAPQLVIKNAKTMDSDDATTTTAKKEEEEGGKKKGGVPGDSALESVTASDGTERAVKYVFTTRGGVRLAIPGGLYFESSWSSRSDIHHFHRQEKDDRDDDGSDDQDQTEDGTWIDGTWFPSAPMDEEEDNDQDEDEAAAELQREDDYNEATAVVASSTVSSTATGGGSAPPATRDYVSDAHFDHLVSRVQVSMSAAPTATRRRHLRTRNNNSTR